jgi:hypothetical protein
MHLKNSLSKTNLILFIILIIVVLLTVGLVYRVVSKSNAPTIVTPDTIQEQSGELINYPPRMVDISEKTSLFTITGSYLQFPQADAGFNKNLVNIFQEEINLFKKDMTANNEYQGAPSGNDELGAYIAQNGSPYSYDITHQVIQSNEKFISFITRFSGYTGGAHGFQNSIAINYDVVNKKMISITDLEAINDVSQQSRIILKQQFQAKGDWHDDLQNWINEGTDPTNPQNFDLFTFTDSILTVYFEQYQVAPYMYGESQVEIERK